MNTEAITNVRVSRSVGRYNFANPSEEQVCLSVIFTIDGTKHVIEDTVEPHSEHDCEDEDVTEMVEAIARSVERYLYSSRRDKTRASIAVFRENEEAIRREYAKTMAARYQRLAYQHARTAQAYLFEAAA
jgi:sulfite reductase beta subunit-like hemoprotein